MPDNKPPAQPSQEENKYLRMMQEDSPAAGTMQGESPNYGPGVTVADPGWGDIGKGVLREGANLASGAYGFGRKALELIPALKNSQFGQQMDANQATLDELARPRNMGEAMGSTGAKMLSYAIPAKAEQGALEATETLPRLVQPLARIGISSASGAGMSALNRDPVTAGALGGAAIGTLGEGVRAAAPVLERLKDPLRAYRSPLIPADEAVARAAADVIRPNPLEYRGVVKTLREQAPYLSPGGKGKFSSPLELAKTAQKAGEEQSNFFRHELVEPNRDYANIGPTFDRLQEVNNQLRGAYRARTMGQQMTQLDRDSMAALEAERDKLNAHLYSNLSARTGLSEDQIRAFNQRGAQLQSLADTTDAAQATRRAGFSGYTPQGLPIPITGVDRALRLVSYLQGGPEAAAGRKLTRVMGNVKGMPEPLPDFQGLVDYRRASDVEELGHLRNQMETAEQNRANARMRTQVARPILEEQGKQLLQRLRAGGGF